MIRETNFYNYQHKYRYAKFCVYRPSTWPYNRNVWSKFGAKLGFNCPLVELNISQNRGCKRLLEFHQPKAVLLSCTTTSVFALRCYVFHVNPISPGGGLKMHAKFLNA